MFKSRSNVSSFPSRWKECEISVRDKGYWEKYLYTTIVADLPPEKLKLFSPPFSVSGVDLFGRFHLKYGRNKKVKAWRAVFTCITVRAIHLEIVTP